MAPETDRTSLLTAMSESILAMAGEPRLEPVLRRLVEGARDLVNARYAAIGVPDEGFSSGARLATRQNQHQQLGGARRIRYLLDWYSGLLRKLRQIVHASLRLSRCWFGD